MKTFKTLIVATLVLLSITINAQTTNVDAKNYVLTNVSYAFFGTGDLSGSSLGINYHRMITNRFGLNAGYSKASGNGSGIINLIDGYRLREVNTTGENIAFETGNYNSLNLGLTYKILNGTHQNLLLGGGLNYKSLHYNYVNSAYFESQPDGTTDVYITGTEYNNEKEIGYFISVDYLVFFKSGFGLGVHASVENSDNILSKVGASLAYKF